MTDIKIIGYSKKPNKKGYFDVCISVGKTENYVGEFAYTVTLNAEKLNELGIYDKVKENPILGGVISTLNYEIRSKLVEGGWHRDVWIGKKSDGWI